MRHTCPQTAEWNQIVFPSCHDMNDTSPDSDESQFKSGILKRRLDPTQRAEATCASYLHTRVLLSIEGGPRRLFTYQRTLEISYRRVLWKGVFHDVSTCASYLSPARRVGSNSLFQIKDLKKDLILLTLKKYGAKCASYLRGHDQFDARGHFSALTLTDLFRKPCMLT